MKYCENGEIVTKVSRDGVGCVTPTSTSVWVTWSGQVFQLDRARCGTYAFMNEHSVITTLGLRKVWESAVQLKDKSNCFSVALMSNLIIFGLLQRELEEKLSLICKLFWHMSDGYVQSFGKITPVMVKAHKLVQMRLISYGSYVNRIDGILKLSYFWQNFNMPISHKGF